MMIFQLTQFYIDFCLLYIFTIIHATDNQLNENIIFIFSVCISMSGILVKDSIIIEGEDGRHEIQLCFGDITKLSKKEKVDVVMVSAFPSKFSLSTVKSTKIYVCLLS